MTADPTEMTEEEMMQAVAFMKAQRMNQDLITNYDARVQRIQQIRVGDEIRTPYRQLSPETQRLIQAECEGQWGHYCVSSYTTTLHESTREQGYEGRDELFPKKENDKDKSYSSYTLHAKEYVENNFKDAATSLKDFPEGTTLGEALKFLYERGKLPKGSMIIVQSDRSPSGGHCVMFMGIDEETGQPLYSSNNPEKRNDFALDKGWSNQTAGKDFPYIVNTQQIIATRQMEIERQAMQEMGSEAYYAEHQAELAAYRAYCLEHGLIAPEPRRIDRIPPLSTDVSSRLSAAYNQEMNQSASGNSEMSPADRARLKSMENEGEVASRAAETGNTPVRTTDPKSQSATYSASVDRSATR